MQILVVVASIQPRTLKIEVEKGSMLTAVAHGVVGPERQGRPLQCGVVLIVKGDVVKNPPPRVEHVGDRL